jgi:hypothetical protein
MTELLALEPPPYTVLVCVLPFDQGAGDARAMASASCQRTAGVNDVVDLGGPAGHGSQVLRLLELKNCAHWPQWEDPEAFNTAVRNFLLG